MISFILTLTNYKLHEKVSWLAMVEPTHQKMSGRRLDNYMPKYGYKTINSSVICMYDTRSDHFYPYFGIYSSAYAQVDSPHPFEWKKKFFSTCLGATLDLK